jgi:signal transduction histidine kinase
MSSIPYVILYLITTGICGTLAYFAWRRREEESRALSFLMGALTFWSVCHSLAATQTTLGGALFWTQFQYGGIALVSPLWLLFALAYARQLPQLAKQARMALLAPAGLFFLAAVSNDIHHWWWTGAMLDAEGLRVTPGWLFWLHAGYSYACLAAGFVIIIQAIRVRLSINQREAQLVVLGALIPLVGNIAYLLGYRLLILDEPLPFLFTASSLVFFYAVFRYRFGDRLQLVQGDAFAHMSDGVLLLDTSNRIVAINAAAAQLLKAPQVAPIGQSIPDAFGNQSIASGISALVTEASVSITRRITDSDAQHSRIIEARVDPISADGARTGAILLLREVTAQVQSEQQADSQIAELTLAHQLARVAGSVEQLDDLPQALNTTLPYTPIILGILQPDAVSLRLLTGETADNGASSRQLPEMMPASSAVLDALRKRQACEVPAADLHMALAPTSLLAVPLIAQDVAVGVLFIGPAQPSDMALNQSAHLTRIGLILGEALVRIRRHVATQQANHIQSAFLSMMSDELRTPVTSIVQSSDALATGIFGTLLDRPDEPLTYIRRDIRTLARLTEEMSDMSKMTAEHFDLDLYPVDIADVVQVALDALQPQIEERDLRLNIDIPPEMPPIYANRVRLQQTLTQLITAAIDVAPNGEIRVRAALRGDYIRLGVQIVGVALALEDELVALVAPHPFLMPHAINGATEHAAPKLLNGASESVAGAS